MARHGATRHSPEVKPEAVRLHAALPQTQCTRCGYPDCAGYAQAIANGEAAINQCPPGGAEGIGRLAALTKQEPQPLNPANGIEGPRAVAVIDESWCIGCTLCVDVCPTDAILGSNKLMHTVIERYCTGCELCLPACPVDCIEMLNMTGERTGWQAWSAAQAAEALARYASRQLRLAGHPQAPVGPIQENCEPSQTQPAAGTPGAHADTERRRAVIEAAVARARARGTRSG